MLSHSCYCIFLPAKEILLNFTSVVKKIKHENNQAVDVYSVLVYVNEQTHSIIFMTLITQDRALMAFLMGLFYFIIL